MMVENVAVGVIKKSRIAGFLFFLFFMHCGDL